MRATGFGILAVTLATVAAGPLQAAEDPLANYYANTVLSANQPLYQIRLWFYPDGTFKQFKASHETGEPHVAGWEGTYTVQGNQVCMKYNPTVSPAAMPPPTPGCSTFEPRKLGEVWTKTYDSGPYKGTTETFILSEGHNTEP